MQHYIMIILSFSALEISILSLDFDPGTLLMRGYNATSRVNITISNSNDTFSITPVTSNRQNFDIMIYLPNTTHNEPQIMDSEFITPLVTLQNGLDSMTNMDISGDFTILVPREYCTSYDEICVAVTAASNSSYSDPDGYLGHTMCIDVTQYINCQGLFIS